MLPVLLSLGILYLLALVAGFLAVMSVTTAPAAPRYWSIRSG